MTWRIIPGDCIESMRGMDEASVDAVVCDPPYGLGFMGKEWDGPASFVERRAAKRNTFDHVGGNHNPTDSRDAARTRRVEGQRMGEWCEVWATEALRVLKPGGHLLAFGGTRTYHRLACAIEDAGFEIRDCLAWLYGSGFPKSLDVSKAIDKAAGAEREVVGPSRRHGGGSTDKYDGPERWQEFSPVTAPVHSPGCEEDEEALCPECDTELFLGHDPECSQTMDAPIRCAPGCSVQWQGWGTALKPAHEPIVLARKPLTGTVAGNVLAHGTGALNVDGCRVGYASDAEVDEINGRSGAGKGAIFPQIGRDEGTYEANPTGRWPANVILDPEAAAQLDEQSGEQKDGVAVNRNRPDGGSTYDATSYMIGDSRREDVGYGGAGGAGRFFPTFGHDEMRFRYTAKASRAERNAGLEGFEERDHAERSHYAALPDQRMDREQARNPAANVHPTVKPIALMRWLCRLVTPPGGTILDPFTGSGTTGAAAVLEGFDFIGCERETEYVAIAEARIAYWAQYPGAEVEAVLEADSKRDPDQLDLLGEAA